jgi:hypothetical protein
MAQQSYRSPLFCSLSHSYRVVYHGVGSNTYTFILFIHWFRQVVYGAIFCFVPYSIPSLTSCLTDWPTQYHSGIYIYFILFLTTSSMILFLTVSSCDGDDRAQRDGNSYPRLHSASYHTPLCTALHCSTMKSVGINWREWCSNHTDGMVWYGMVWWCFYMQYSDVF